MNMPGQPQMQQQQPPQMNQQSANAAPGVMKTAAQPWGGFWKRFVAALIDGIALSVVVMPLQGILLGSTMAGIQPSATGEIDPNAVSGMMGVMVLYLVVTLGIYVAYFAGMESSKFQGTLGKMALGMAVVDKQGRRISFGTAFVRLLVKMFLSGILFIGYLMAAFDERKRSLHDRLASTYVVNKAR